MDHQARAAAFEEMIQETGFEKLVNMAKGRRSQLDVPIKEHMSFIPQVQHSNLLLMKSHKPTRETMTTLFIGSIRKNYTAESFEEDRKKWMDHFGKEAKYFSVPIGMHEQLPDAIDSRAAICSIESALLEINKLKGDAKLRVIILGTGQAGFLYEALTYLLREWKYDDGKPRKDKYMQFITSGDTADHDLNNFCQWLCIAGVCETIEFNNTMNYHPFGFCKQEYRS